jgi:hypothetical protein
MEAAFRVLKTRLTFLAFRGGCGEVKIGEKK